MSRVEGVDPDETEGYVRRVLEAQKKHWGGPLLNHLVYARRPDLFKAVRGMWIALNRDQVLPDAMVAMVNRRVASLNGCVF